MDTETFGTIVAFTAIVLVMLAAAGVIFGLMKLLIPRSMVVRYATLRNTSGRFHSVADASPADSFDPSDTNDSTSVARPFAAEPRSYVGEYLDSAIDTGAAFGPSVFGDEQGWLASTNILSHDNDLYGYYHPAGSAFDESSAFDSGSGVSSFDDAMSLGTDYHS